MLRLSKILYQKLLMCLATRLNLQYFANLLAFILFGRLLITVLLQDNCIAYMMEDGNSFPTSQELTPNTSNSNDNDSITIIDINKKMDRIIDSVEIVTDALKDKTVNEVAERIGDCLVIGVGGGLILKMMQIIPHPGWKAFCGISSFATLNFRLSFIQWAKIKERSHRQGPIDQYLERLGASKSRGNHGPGSDGGNSNNDDQGGDGRGNFQEYLQQSQNVSDIERSSNFNTNQGTHRGIDFSEPQHGFSNWEFKHDCISTKEFYKLFQEDQMRNKEVFDYQNPKDPLITQQLLSSADEQSIVVSSPLEKFSDNIIKIWTELETLSYVELGFIVCSLCLFTLLFMSIALIIFLVRNQLLKFFITKNQWIPRPILNFLNTRFLQDNATLPLFFYVYYFFINLIAVWHLYAVISGFMVEFSNITNKIDFYFLMSLKCIWLLYIIIFLMMFEILKPRLTAIFLKNIKIPAKIRVYLETPFSVLYVFFLLLCLLTIVNYLDWVFTTILEPALSFYDDDDGSYKK